MTDLATPAGGPTSSIDEAKRQKLLELVRGRALARPTDLAEDEVMVWPSLVVVEAVCATVFLLILVLLSIFVGAPLTEMANPNATPNPSKAPWYFLNLQELLLHMDAGLAGVIIPTIALGAIAAIPYIDRSPLGVGILGTSTKGRRIAAFSAVFTFVVVVAMVYIDEQFDRKQFGIGTWLAENHGASEFITGIILPSIILLVLIFIMAGIIYQVFKPTPRELIIGLFTAFYVSYWVLTIVGTSFRGPSQTLVWPWELPLTHH
ncbi:MAG: menaquinol-cytochrome C reductase [Thermomicrobiales bacterium]|nr:menaquinol-cytochrome C reductase [Thermomicrobiales bacterium]